MNQNDNQTKMSLIGKAYLREDWDGTNEREYMVVIDEKNENSLDDILFFCFKDKKVKVTIEAFED